MSKAELGTAGLDWVRLGMVGMGWAELGWIVVVTVEESGCGCGG